MDKDFVLEEITRMEMNKEGFIVNVKKYTLRKYNGKEKKIVIPKAYNNLVIGEISSNCFDNNSFIEEIILPDSILSIKQRAFENCNHLKKINLENVRFIGEYAFHNTNIEEVNIKHLHKIESNAFLKCENLKEIKVKEGLKEIPKDTFKNCMNLKLVILPDSLKKIEEYAFNNCPNIIEIKYPNNVLLNDNSFDKGIMDRIQKNSKEMEKKIEKYDLNRLINETNNLSMEEKENYIKNLLKEHKLDNLDLSSISKMNHIGFNKETNELTWKCFKHGYCSCDILDLLKDNKKMIENFEYNGCGYCE